MRKLFLAISIFLFLFVTIDAQVFAQSGYSPRAVKVVTFSPDKDDNKDFYTLWGEVVELTGEINADVYVAGGEVVVKGIVNGDVLAVAGKISIEGEVKGNLRVIADNVEISGSVGNNVTAIGSLIRLTPQSEIVGGIILLSESSEVLGQVGGQIKLIGERITLNNFIGSDAEIWVNKLNLGPETKLSDLTYYSKNNAVVDSEASISGKLIKGENTLFGQDINISGFRDSVNDYASKGTVFLAIVNFLWALLIGIIYLRFFPKTFESITSTLDKYFVKSALIGLFSLFAVPILIFILMVTIVGIPVGLLVLITFLIFIYSAKISVSFWIGNKIIKDNNKTYSALVLGLLIYYLLTYLYILGGIVVFITLISGLGAEIIGVFKHHKNLLKKKII